MRFSASMRILFAGIAMIAAGCAGSDGRPGDDEELGDIGAPCELEEHCADGLICDVHGEYGSCQEPHDH